MEGAPTMRFLLFLLTFFGSLFLRGLSIPSAFVLAILVVILVSLVLRIVRREARKLPKPRQKRVPTVEDGDIGPYLAYMLERGDRDAVVACIAEHIPAWWPSRQGLFTLAEEHCRLQRSIRIATVAGVPMPEDTAAFSTQQTQLIADRARRMAFIHQHGLMNDRIEASLNRLTRGADSLARQSTVLRAELAESTGNPQWGEQEERELRRTLERMANTLRAMSSDLLADEFDNLAPAKSLPATKNG
jgi:FlaA1/EpsC-like NDP-sugar epimerase